MIATMIIYNNYSPYATIPARPVTEHEPGASGDVKGPLGPVCQCGGAGGGRGRGGLYQYKHMAIAVILS